MKSPIPDYSPATEITQSSSQSSPCQLPQTRVLLAVSVVQEADPDTEQWVSWLTSQAPSDVTQVEVQVEGIYRSHSTLVLISMPTFAWDRLPERTAYRFIGFLKSANLLQKSDTKTSTQSSASSGGDIDIDGLLNPKSTPKRKTSLSSGNTRTVRPRLSPFETPHHSVMFSSTENEESEPKSQYTHVSTGGRSTPIASNHNVFGVRRNPVSQQKDNAEDAGHNKPADRYPSPSAFDRYLIIREDEKAQQPQSPSGGNISNSSSSPPVSPPWEPYHLIDPGTNSPVESHNFLGLPTPSYGYSSEESHDLLGLTTPSLGHSSGEPGPYLQERQ